ncbi:glycosyltransferase PgfM1 [Streptococcus pacificus]|uniref:YfhO family protein n=1 Tax=Streptococcus pacificus TaxID=2740577 RepID=A0ABS0ZHL3_9STRE|nr:YfhO family protein [Streptococcus pacificus]MBJ8325476.1 YfhO family protein [Streptococcus pacificus]
MNQTTHQKSFLKKVYQEYQPLIQKHKKTITYLSSAILPILVMLIVWFFMGAFPFGKKTLMAVDFGQQYISFYGFLKETILTGDWSAFFYSFTKSIGGPMIGILGYYLISPFNIFYILLPLSQFKWAVFLTILLRYGAISLSFSHLLIKRYKGLQKKAWLVPLLSLSYALSGMLVSYQMNVLFYDAMFMLPLVILTLEETLDGKRPFGYILTLALTMFLQFYMGYMICLFVVLYACYYLSPKLATKETLRNRLIAFFLPLFKTAFYSILAIGSVFVLLYPIFLNLLESKGAIGGALLFSWDFQINPLDILSKLFVGGFDDNSWSKGPSLPNIYVGALSLISFFFYFRHVKDHLYQKIATGLVVSIFLISFVNEFTSKIWHMGQNPAGFFYRFSWIFSFFIILITYKVLKTGVKISTKELILALVIALASVIYVVSQSYTYIALKQVKAITSFVAENPRLVIFLLTLIPLISSYFIWLKKEYSALQRIILIIIVALTIPAEYFLLLKGFLLTQVVLTLFTWILVLLLYYFGPSRLLWTLIYGVTIFELGLNAYLSQYTLYYADADKFTDATISVKEVTDKIQKESKVGFYRIGTTFSYSRTTPSLVSYPGLSSFSSSLERSTMDLFSYLGDIGVNASTQYTNGTLLTDALFAVRYYVDVKDHTQEEIDEHPEKMFFNKNSSRFDLTSYYHKIDENDRYLVYENPNVFSVAFGTNSVTQSILFGLNNPIANQNIILKSMAGTDTNYFEQFSFSDIEIENMEKVDGPNGQPVYNRIDKNQLGIIRFKIIPKSSFTYYFLTPSGLETKRDNLSILLNNKWLTNQKSYSQKQLWQLTHNTEGQETVLEMRFSDDEVYIENAGLVRANNVEIEKILADRLKQSMTVTEWTNTTIKGFVDITDNSDVMMTSIPYSSDWNVTVDGKKVETTKAWNSLLSFPITSGKHTIEMHYSPKGLKTGIAVSALSISMISFLWYKDKKSPHSYK